MTYISWPPELPSCPGTDYGESFKDNVIRSSMETGIQKTRQRYTRKQRILDLVFLINDLQKVIFSEFFDNIKGGAIPFEMLDPVLQMPIVVRCTGQINGPVYVTKNLWRIQFQVEVLNDIL